MIRELAAPNQKIVIVSRAKTEGPFSIFYRESAEAAAKELDGNPFKLWTFLSLNQNGYKIELSSRELYDRFGLKKDAYDRSVNALIKAGYLVRTTRNMFIFYDQKPGKPTFKSGEKPLLLSGKPTFKSGESPQEIIHTITGENSDNIVCENNIHSDGSSSTKPNKGKPPQPPPAYHYPHNLPSGLRNCFSELVKNYGTETAGKAWDRVLENSPPGDKSRMTIAYLKAAAKGIANYGEEKDDDPIMAAARRAEKRRKQEEEIICIRDESIPDWN